MALWDNKDNAESKPKYLSQDEKDICGFVSIEEAQNPVNRARGVKTPGWWIIDEALGIKECLVAVSVSQTVSGDANDDDVLPEDPDYDFDSEGNPV